MLGCRFTGPPLAPAILLIFQIYEPLNTLLVRMHWVAAHARVASLPLPFAEAKKALENWVSAATEIAVDGFQPPRLSCRSAGPPFGCVLPADSLSVLLQHCAAAQARVASLPFPFAAAETPPNPGSLPPRNLL